MSESSKALEDAVQGITEEHAAGRPTSGGWSIAQIVEHVGVSEEQMFFALTERFRPVPNPIHDAERENRLRDLILDRGEKMISPEVSRPAGRFPTLAAALSHFRQCRARTVQYVEHCKDDQRRRSVKHPLAGVVSGYEYLLILASHPSRHAGQIRELRATMGI